MSIVLFVLSQFDQTLCFIAFCKFYVLLTNIYCSVVSEGIFAKVAVLET